MTSSSSHAESTPLLGLQFLGGKNNVTNNNRSRERKVSNEQRQNMLWAIFLAAACVMSVFILKTSANKHGMSLRATETRDIAKAKDLLSSLENHTKKKSSSPYTKVQTLSFQIYTGGAPAFITDESTGEERKNPECKGLNSYGLPEDSEAIQCYLGLEDSADDVQRRLGIMTDAVNRAYDVSDQDNSTLKIFLAPEFFFRGVNGAFEFLTEEEEQEEGACSDICHILKGLEDIVAHKRFEDWLFLFGTVIASETLPNDNDFDYEFYNFAPLLRGFDPAKSKRIGKNFLVPKRYVSNIDFMTPLRDLTMETNVKELLDEPDLDMDRTLMNPHASGAHRYNNNVWSKYKDELTSLGYNMIEYGWFFMDGISFSVEICLDHLIHRALMTYMADIVTGSKTKVPSSANDNIEWVGIPKHQAQISLVSSAGMDVTVSSLALADGGYIFLQDGIEGNVSARVAYGQDDCQPNEYEFFGGSQCIKRTAVISATDVTFEYEMNMNFHDYDLYPESGQRPWQHVLKGVFSTSTYQPKLTVYDSVDITLAL